MDQSWILLLFPSNNLCCLFCLLDGAQPLQLWGRQGGKAWSLAQEIAIPGDFTVDLPRNKGDGAMPLSFVCFEQPNEFGLILQGCCCILLAMTRCVPQTLEGGGLWP